MTTELCILHAIVCVMAVRIAILFKSVLIGDSNMTILFDSRFYVIL